MFLLRIITAFLTSLSLLSATPVVSEFLASNATGLTDLDGDNPDWIEIHNPGPNAVDLTGWYLSDDPDLPTRWTFPATTLSAGGYLVVFASGKDRLTGPELHTNFSLSKSGEFLALTSPDGQVVSSFTYPAQATDVSYGPTKSGNELVLITAEAPAKALIPDAALDASIGTTWRSNDPSFDDSSWLVGNLGVGLERSSGFQNDIGLDVGAAWGVNSSVYIRVPILSDLDPAAVRSLTLRMKYDDGFAAFLNGTYVAGDNDPSPLLYQSDATGGRPDSLALQFADFDLTPHRHLLTPSNNLLAIHGLNQFSNSGDLLIRPELVATLEQAVASSVGFFPTPTPGAENPTANFEAFLDDTTFLLGRGIYQSAFTETIASTDPGASLIYTTDGSIPTAANGTIVPPPDALTPAQATVPITTTTILRVIATRTNALPTNIDTPSSRRIKGISGRRRVAHPRGRIAIPSGRQKVPPRLLPRPIRHRQARLQPLRSPGRPPARQHHPARGLL